MRIIDFHAHAFADSLAPKAIPSLETRGDLTARYDGTVAGLVAAMDRNGVDVSVIQPVATKPGQVAVINEWAASLASDRIIPFGAMHPDLPDPGAEMARMRGLGLKGFKLHPEHQEFAPDEPRMEAIYSSAEKTLGLRVDDDPAARLAAVRDLTAALAAAIRPADGELTAA